MKHLGISFPMASNIHRPVPSNYWVSTKAGAQPPPFCLLEYLAISRDIIDFHNLVLKELLTPIGHQLETWVTSYPVQVSPPDKSYLVPNVSETITSHSLLETSIHCQCPSSLSIFNLSVLPIHFLVVIGHPKKRPCESFE